MWGLERGYSLMIGGDAGRRARRSSPIFTTLAPGDDGVAATPGRTPGTADHGYLHCGPSGAGHFVKMIHNGIEYGLMQAYAEGFDLLRNAGSLDACRTASRTTSTSPTSPRSGATAASSGRGCST